MNEIELNDLGIKKIEQTKLNASAKSGIEIY
jgi:hypothetical protein